MVVPENRMIASREPLSRVRMRPHEEEELPAEVSSAGKRRKLRPNNDLDASEHMVIIMPFLQSLANS